MKMFCCESALEAQRAGTRAAANKRRAKSLEGRETQRNDESGGGATLFKILSAAINKVKFGSDFHFLRTRLESPVSHLPQTAFLLPCSALSPL